MAIASHSNSHNAVDINEDALDAARATHPDIGFRSGGVLSLPFRTPMSTLPSPGRVGLQHIRPTMIDKAAAEIRRVLAPGATLLICEETRDKASSGGHTWHRSVASYEQILAPPRLERHGLIDAIAIIPGMQSRER